MHNHCRDVHVSYFIPKKWHLKVLGLSRWLELNDCVQIQKSASATWYWKQIFEKSNQHNWQLTKMSIDSVMFWSFQKQHFKRKKRDEIEMRKKQKRITPTKTIQSTKIVQNPHKSSSPWVYLSSIQCDSAQPVQRRVLFQNTACPRHAGRLWPFRKFQAEVKTKPNSESELFQRSKIKILSNCNRIHGFPVSHFGIKPAPALPLKEYAAVQLKGMWAPSNLSVSH